MRKKFALKAIAESFQSICDEIIRHEEETSECSNGHGWTSVSASRDSLYVE